MQRALYALPLAVFVAIALYFAWALRPNHDPHELPSALLDKPAPAFSLPALTGDQVIALADLRGHAVVVNFFASWCVPCRIEHPLLMRLAEREHVPIVGIAYKDKPEDARRILAELGDPYARVAMDREGRTGIDFGLYGVPETYVIDAGGTIRRKFVGPLRAEAIQRDLLPLLRELNGQ